MMFDLDPSSEGEAPARSIRLCSETALQVYKECRHAIFSKEGGQWIVPPKMGIRDFLRVVGHQFDEDGELEEGLDLPGETCMDLTAWSAGSFGKLPSVILLGISAVISAIVLF
jgi:hypothetical protein